ncbi:PstS family phosphate ABC transporter substrate-binding protein [Gordonibacter massiliensis (ex Traore et al. 2017)]|uniref:Substrate-binding domain-containing protein n=1 Tax=Gordonibacter massiliensis (ex Traore et al. 2017) TaxID=1841863 RepID=A0A842JGH6_9ACTN|nr:substrate-binding domain-containing protein [Gordonibacter massiliensis (ex Traore et al. 2017)]MBC2890524.1 substrate-binding domain-containing protein [Gordonibacter massiliensis (ex Traore et al. 2017)]
MADEDVLRRRAKALHVLRTAVTVLLVCSIPFGLFFLLLSPYQYNALSFVLPCAFFVLLVALVWTFDRKRPLVVVLSLMAVVVAATVVNYFVETQGTLRQFPSPDAVSVDESIDYEAYLPFESESIARLDGPASLQLPMSDDLPKVDSAAALLPLASSFVTAVYPEGITVMGSSGYDPSSCVFQFNNTVRGYEALAEGETDVFFGALPSEEQIAHAAERGVEFECTPIGQEAFVFFVNEANPVESLTVEQIRDIYAGKIDNWSEVGGRDAPIVPYQRNEGSGSQSQMKRFMGTVRLGDAPKVLRSGSMGGVVRSVADYDNGIDAIGYSFRYYVSDLVGVSNIRMLALDGAEPTMENIASGAYPLADSFYAVTRKGEENPDIALLLDWVRSEQGQLLVERSGYARMKTD